MKTYLDCVPCFVRQALDASRMVTDDPAIHERIVRTTLESAASMRFDQPPPLMGQQIHQQLRALTGQQDPYRKVKQHSNALATKLLPAMEKHIADAEDPLACAVKIAIAGNIIDFGCKTSICDNEVEESLNQALSSDLDPTAISRFKQAVSQAGSILCLADNAGEIVFDRLLIEQLPAGKVIVAVRGQPVINDATHEDALEAGIDRVARVIDNGCDIPGTVVSRCSSSFQECLRESDLVIAKGQGNYETLDALDKHVFFLLKIKCPVIARHSGHAVGSIVMHERQPTMPTNTM